MAIADLITFGAEEEKHFPKKNLKYFLEEDNGNYRILKIQKIEGKAQPMPDFILIEVEGNTTTYEVSKSPHFDEEKDPGYYYYKVKEHPRNAPNYFMI